MHLICTNVSDVTLKHHCPVSVTSDFSARSTIVLHSALRHTLSLMRKLIVDARHTMRYRKIPSSMLAVLLSLSADQEMATAASEPGIVRVGRRKGAAVKKLQARLSRERLSW
jgi:hypothetical protein